MARDRLTDTRPAPRREQIAVRLTCRHRVVVAEAVARTYPFAFCGSCDEVRDFAKKRPAVRRIHRF